MTHEECLQAVKAMEEANDIAEKYANEFIAASGYRTKGYIGSVSSDNGFLIFDRHDNWSIYMPLMYPFSQEFRDDYKKNIEMLKTEEEKAISAKAKENRNAQYMKLKEEFDK